MLMQLFFMIWNFYFLHISANQLVIVPYGNELVVCMWVKRFIIIIAKPYNSLHARPSRYVADLSVGNLWYENNFSRMPGSWQIDVAFCRPNGPPCVEGVSDVLCGVVECERRKGAKNQSTSKTSHLAYSTLHRHVSFVFLKSSNFITSTYPFKFRFVSMERQYILSCTCESAQ